MACAALAETAAMSKPATIMVRFMEASCCQGWPAPVRMRRRAGWQQKCRIADRGFITSAHERVACRAVYFGLCLTDRVFGKKAVDWSNCGEPALVPSACIR